MVSNREKKHTKGKDFTLKKTREHPFDFWRFGGGEGEGKIF